MTIACATKMPRCSSLVRCGSPIPTVFGPDAKAKLRLAVVTEMPDRELTLELFRRGVHAIVSREVDSELFVDCLRTIAKGEPWLEPHAVKWVLESYRTQGTRPHATRSKVQLTPKESLIVSCVTQGMKNKEIATRVGTTEQVVKNYLRKVYDKLGVADRLELALYCLNNRVLLDTKQAAPAQSPTEPSQQSTRACFVRSHPQK